MNENKKNDFIYGDQEEKIIISEYEREVSYGENIRMDNNESLNVSSDELITDEIRNSNTVRASEMLERLRLKDKEASNFYLECEKSLFKIIVGVFERKDINNKLIGNERFIDTLYAINNTELNNELDKFKQLPPKIKQAILVGLEIRLGIIMKDINS